MQGLSVNYILTPDVGARRIVMSFCAVPFAHPCRRRYQLGASEDNLVILFHGLHYMLMFRRPPIDMPVWLAPAVEPYWRLITPWPSCDMSSARMSAT